MLVLATFLVLISSQVHAADWDKRPKLALIGVGNWIWGDIKFELTSGYVKRKTDHKAQQEGGINMQTESDQGARRK